MKELIDLYRAKQRAEHPDFPEAYLPKKKFTDKTHNGLISCIVEFLNLSGHQAERKSTTGRPIDRTKVVKDALGRTSRIGSIEWIPGTGRKGSADISATLKVTHQGRTFGISVKIEAKVGRDFQKPDQKDYQQEIEMAGGLYWLCRSFAEFKAEYDKLMAGKQD